MDIRPQEGAQTRFLQSSADIAITGGSAFGGKAVEINTLIPTERGFVRMGEIKPGHRVFAIDGTLSTVLEAFEITLHEDAYEVEFDSGEVFVVDGDHLWKTMTYKERVDAFHRTEEFRDRRRANRPSRAKEVKKNYGASLTITRVNQEREYEYLEPSDGEVRTTSEILETLKVRSDRVNHSVALAKPIELPHNEFIIDPYLFGLWLGDGCASFGLVGCAEEDMNVMLKHIKFGKVIYEKVECNPPRKTPYKSVRFEGLTSYIRKYGLYKNKHIPIEYLRSSKEQRIELLRGLMDTDGTCDKNGKCSISLSDEQLIKDVQELLCSLGIKCSYHAKPIPGYKTSYGISFTADFSVFHLQRKKDRQQMRKVRSERRYIVDVRKTEPCFMRCIRIDHPSHLYLMGRTFVPTHNTYSLLLEAARHVGHPKYQGIIFRRESVQITSPGGLRDTSMDVYPHLGGLYRAQPSPRWIFPSGAQITFAHLNNEDTVLNYQGSQMTLIAYDELTHFCVDDQTEALTENGWKLIKDISIGELVASLSKNRQIQYQPVTQVYENDYSGEMVVIEQRNGIDVKVTPNHRMVVNVSDTGLQGKAAFGSWKFVEARNLMTCSVPRTGDWIGEEVEYQYFEPIHGRGYGTNSNSCVEYVPTDDWLEFLGWYLSEGCCYCRNNRTNTRVVSIRQTKPNGQLLLEEVLDRLPWRYSKTKDGQYLFFSRQLYEELAELGDTYAKRVPRWIFSLSKRQISLFLDAFTAGDGHITQTNGIAFGLANEKLIDDLQELYFKCGRVSTKSYGKVAGKYDVWRLGVSNPKRSHCFVNIKDSRYESYEGKIYCLSVRENENFMMRRNGRICWTGNSRFQFFYMLSRARSMSGIKPYIRGSTNPDSDSWVAEFISWWIDQETGYPIPERSGVLRYLIRVDDKLIWADSKAELMAQYDCGIDDINSVTFVPSKATDNPLGLKADPSYIGRLKAMSRVERARLLDGNWKIRPVAGMYFPRFDTTILDWKPTDVVKWIRSWDLAASEESEGRDPDWTCGVLAGRRANGKIVIADIVRVRRKAADVRSLVKNMAYKDGKETWCSIPRDPGQAGKEQAESYLQMLQGFTVISRAITRNKLIMAEPAAALWQQGNIELVRADWNEVFLQELEQFPEGRHDDLVDCLSACVRNLPGHAKPDYSQSGLNGRFKEVRSTRRVR